MGMLLGGVLLLGGCAVMPVPITDVARQERLQADVAELFKDQEPITAPLTLHEAIARALKYNMEQRVKLMEKAVARGALDVSRYDLLPSLAVTAGYVSRSNEAGGRSLSLLTNTQSLEPSTSQERDRTTGNVNMVWNVLDFGVSYAQAQQIADEVLIADELRRKVIQNIVLDVQSAWWRAVAAQQELGRIEAMLKRAREALGRQKQLEDKKLQEPMQALQAQRNVLDLVDRMIQLRREMSLAKVELAGLMNLKPGSRYEVAVPPDLTPPVLPKAGLGKLEELALLLRPELREEDYRKRISTLEVRKAMLRMFPGLEIRIDGNYDSNKFLFNNSWLEAGLQVSWNVFSLFSAPAAKRQAESQVALADARRMALSVAVLTQLHLAWQQLKEAQDEYQLASQLSNVEGRISKQVSAARKAKKADATEEMMSQASALASDLRLGLARAELYTALARIRNTMGDDPLPAEVAGHDLATLSQAIETHMQRPLVQAPSAATQ